MATSLAFHTDPGAALIPIGQRILLGSVDVHRFRQIRVLVVSRPGFDGQVGVILQYAIPKLGWTPAWLDVIHISTLEQKSETYEVPGLSLNVYGDAANVTSGTPAVDVLVFGAT